MMRTKGIGGLGWAGGLMVMLSTAARAGDYAILPNRGIGKVTLGATRQAVHKRLGKPDKTDQLRGVMDDLWVLQKSADPYDKPQRIEVLYRAGKVIQIEVTLPQFATPKGISTRMNIKQIKTRYKNLRVSDYLYDDASGSGHHNYYFDSVPTGIAFEFEGYQELLSPLSKPTTIIVHRAGLRVLPDSGGKPFKITAPIIRPRPF